MQTSQVRSQSFWNRGGNLLFSFFRHPSRHCGCWPETSPVACPELVQISSTSIIRIQCLGCWHIPCLRACWAEHIGRSSRCFPAPSATFLGMGKKNVGSCRHLILKTPWRVIRTWQKRGSHRASWSSGNGFPSRRESVPIARSVDLCYRAIAGDSFVLRASCFVS